MDQPQNSISTWAVLEMFGHAREIGFVTTEAYGQAVLFRVDTPELPEREFELLAPEWIEIEGSSRMCPAGSKVKRAAVPARTRLVGPGAIYAINPCTEEAARAAMERAVQRPLILIEMPKSAPLELPPLPQSDEEYPF